MSPWPPCAGAGCRGSNSVKGRAESPGPGEQKGGLEVGFFIELKNRHIIYPTSPCGLQVAALAPGGAPVPTKSKGRRRGRKEEVGRGICFGCKRAPVSEAGEQKEGGVKLLPPLGLGEQDRAELEVTAAWQRERATGHSAGRRDKPSSTQDVDVPAGASSLAPGPRPCCSWHCGPSFREAATLAAGWKQSREKGAAPAFGGHRWTLWSPGLGPKAGRVNALHGSGGEPRRLLLPEGRGHAARTVTSGCCCQKQVGATTLRVPGLVGEEAEGQGGHETREERTSPRWWGRRGPSGGVLVLVDGRFLLQQVQTQVAAPAPLGRL